MPPNIFNPYRYADLSIQVCNNCTESVNCDTIAVNPDNGDRRQYGYRLDASADGIGKKLIQVTLRLNNTASSTGDLSVWSKDTKVGSLDVSTIVSSYADYVISCTGSPILAENDVFWWENDANRVGNGNINTKVKTVSGNPANYTYMQSQNDAYGQAPILVFNDPVSNMCFTVQ